MLKAFLKTIETFRLRGELAGLVSRKMSSWEILHVWKDVKCYTNMSSYQLFRNKCSCGSVVRALC